VKAADGSGTEQPVVTFEKGQQGSFLSASPDEKYLSYVTSNAAKKLDIYVVPLTGDRKPQAFLHSPANESAPSLSTDGKWLAYQSDQSGRNDIYVTPFPGGGPRYQVSTGGGEKAVWGRDGKEIFYRAADLKLMAVEVRTRGDTIELGTPKPLFELVAINPAGRFYDVSPDGLFLANTAHIGRPAQNFELLINWPGKK
jgi:serine/threonine-protein kinase